MAVGKLWSVTLDCADPQPLARFWAAVTDGKVAYESENFVGVETPDGMWIGAYRIDGYEPPTWPDGPVAKQFHLDLSVEDIETAAGEAVALGAVPAAEQPGEENWRVLLDPAGHPFCLTTAQV